MHVQTQTMHLIACVVLPVILNNMEHLLFFAGKRGWEYSLLYGRCMEGYNRKKNQLQPDT
jgi:hypothetical protein